MPKSVNCWKYIFDWKTHPCMLGTSSCKLLWKLNVAFNVPSNARLFYKYTAGFVRRFIHQMETCMPPCKALCYTSWHATVSNSAAVTFFERYVRYGTTHHATQSCITLTNLTGESPLFQAETYFVRWNRTLSFKSLQSLKRLLRVCITILSVIYNYKL